MKLMAVICLVLLTSTTASTETGAFQEATHIGQGTARSFFVFSTSTGPYVLRQDGTGEVMVKGRRRLFYLNLSRLERVYFAEYQGDVLFLCAVSDGRNSLGRLVRMNPQTRKVRWLARLEVDQIDSCVVEGDEARCGVNEGVTKIDLKTGALL